MPFELKLPYANSIRQVSASGSVSTAMHIYTSCCSIDQCYDKDNYPIPNTFEEDQTLKDPSEDEGEDVKRSCVPGISKHNMLRIQQSNTTPGDPLGPNPLLGDRTSCPNPISSSY